MEWYLVVIVILHNEEILIHKSTGEVINKTLNTISQKKDMAVGFKT